MRLVTAFQTFGWNYAIGWTWALWLVSWFAAAGWANRTKRNADRAQQRKWALPTAVGSLLVWVPSVNGPGEWNQLWWTPQGVQFVFFLLTLVGFALAWWARIHLGRLWSGSITLKEGHQIVDTGPYRLVRHPIYTGLYLSLLATGLSLGRATALAGVAIVWAATYAKARHEERFLRVELGAEAYDAYAGRTPMLVPFWPVSR